MTDFVISDLHFGHNNIIAYCRPQFTSLDAMHKFMIAQWNSVVGDNDTVYILGDAIFGKRNRGMLHDLNGDKILVAGNHDNGIKTTDWLLDVAAVQGTVPYYAGNIPCVMTHVPVHTQCLAPEGRWRYNLHGHLHTNTVLCKVPNEYMGEVWTPDLRYINCSCEQFHYTPRPIKDLILEREALRL